MKRILLLLVVLATTSNAFSQSAPLYATSPYTDTLWMIVDTTTMAVNVPGTAITSILGTVTGSNGLTIDPCSGAAYVSLKFSGVIGRVICSLNLTTGVADTIVNVGDNVANIDLINDSIIAIIFGDGATASESLGLVNINDSTYTAVGPTTTAGSDGESLAYCPDNDRLYRFSGRNTANVFEYYDVALPIGVDVPITGWDWDETFSSTYIGGGQFLTANLDQEFVLVDTNGYSILLPQTTGANYFKGLAFGGPSISFVAAGTDSICPFGDTTVLGASSSVGYQWYMDGTLIAGATNQTYSATAAGTYTCELVNGTCTGFASESLVVSTFAVDTAIVTPVNPAFCAGDSVLITGNTGTGLNGWWFAGLNVNTTTTINAAVAGGYSYRLQTGACYDEVTVTVIENVLPTVVANADQASYCDGDMVTLTGSGADSYTWDNSVIDGSPFTQAVGAPVMYHLTGTDTITGCVNIDSIAVNVFPNPTASGTSTDEIFGNDGAIDGTFTGAPILTFDWDNDGTGDFDDPEDLTGLTAGTYTVVVMDGNGCTSTTQVIVGSQVGLNEFGLNAEMSIYPNPNDGIFTVDFANMATENLMVQIVDASGKIVFNTDVTGNSVDVNIVEFGAGTYTLRITDGTHNATKQIIVGK